MTDQRTSVVALLAALAWPITNFVAVNLPDLVARGAIRQVAVPIAVLALVGAAVIRATARRFEAGDMLGHRIVLGAAGFALMFFAYGDLVQKASPLGAVPAQAAWIVVTAAVVGCIVVMARHRPFRAAASVLCVAGFLAAAVQLAIAFARLPVTAAADRPVSEASAARLDGTNVYLIVLDGYLGHAEMKSIVDHDNGRFIEAMSGLGFRHLERARANYVMTTFALGGIFNLDYGGQKGGSRSILTGLAFPTIATDPGRLPALMQRYRASGYSVVHLGNRWARCNAKLFDCPEAPRPIDHWVSYATAVFLQKTPLYPLLNALAFTHDPTPLEILPTILDRLPPGKPAFVLAHHMPPHPPYMFLSDCRRRPGFDALDLRGWEPQSKPLYAENAQCAEKLVEKAVQAIVRRDPEGLVIVQSDHGSGFLVDWKLPMAEWQAASINERSSIVNLVRAPERCREWLRPDLGPINTMRFALSCLERRAPDYVVEKTVVTTYDYAYPEICETKAVDTTATSAARPISCAATTP